MYFTQNKTLKKVPEERRKQNNYFCNLGNLSKDLWKNFLIDWKSSAHISLVLSYQKVSSLRLHNKFAKLKVVNAIYLIIVLEGKLISAERKFFKEKLIS